MPDKVLVVDADTVAPGLYQRTLRKRYEVEHVGSAEIALDQRDLTAYVAVVSEARLPRMNGVELLVEVRRRAPDVIRVMLTADTSLEVALAADADAHVFRFLTKPCPPERLASALAAGLVQRRVTAAERELLLKTLRGSVKMLMDVLTSVSPTAFGRGERVRRLVRQMAEQIPQANDWQVEFAAMLSQLGMVTLPEELVGKIARGEPLHGAELRAYLEHPRAGHDLLVNIPRLEGVAQIVRYQEKRWDGSGAPADDRRGDRIPLGARLLKAALDFDSMLSAGHSTARAVREMQGRTGYYDPAVIEAVTTIHKGEIDAEIKAVRAVDLVNGMVLAGDIFSPTGLLLLAKGTEITPSVRLRLFNVASKGGLQEPIRVMTPPPPAPAAAAPAPAAASPEPIGA
jgi:response regulator RpfG family c-di-GMP phosphodiesterase